MFYYKNLPGLIFGSAGARTTVVENDSNFSQVQRTSGF